MKGFTLIEVLVSVALFTVVMVIALGALLAISSSDRKAESLKAVINNLNFSIDSMSRAIRTGQSWGCDSGHTFNPSVGSDCAGGSNGANEIRFMSSSGVTTYYRLESKISDVANAASICGQKDPNIGCIAKSTDGVSWLPITSPEVVINDLEPTAYLFNMYGAAAANTIQPILTITLSGYVVVSGGVTTQAGCNTSGNLCSLFHLQTSVAQRIYDQ